MKQTIATLFMIQFICLSYASFDSEDKYAEGMSIIKLHDSDAFKYRIPAKVEDHDPLQDVAEEILQKIDPQYKPKWPDGYRKECVEYFNEIRPQYDEFWKRIPPDARLYIDLDNDSKEEVFIVSKGLNPDKTLWGFDNFICILRQGDKWRGDEDEKWKVDYFSTFDGSKNLEDPNFASFHLAICDLDYNDRPDIVFTYFKRGGSASANYLRILSLGIDMVYRDHKLWSRKPVTVLEPGNLRPVFIQYDDDGWRRMDCGASVRARGYRRAYYNWTVERGFYSY